METAEEVTVAGPPRVTPRLAGCRRPDCGLPGAAARVDSTRSSPPPLHSAGGSDRMTVGSQLGTAHLGTRALGYASVLGLWHAGMREETRAQLQDANLCGKTPLRGSLHL